MLVFNLNSEGQAPEFFEDNDVSATQNKTSSNSPSALDPHAHSASPTHPDGEAARALAHCVLVCLPLVRA